MNEQTFAQSRKRDASELSNEDLVPNKRIKLDARDYFKIVPNALVISEILKHIGSGSGLRAVSPQFCNIVDQVDPCFAFLKMMKEEVQRYHSCENYQSPWFTEQETEFVDTTDDSICDRQKCPRSE